MELEGNRQRLSKLKDVFRPRGRGKTVGNLRKALSTLIIPLNLPSIPEGYTVMFSADAVDRIVRDRTAVSEVTKKSIEKLARGEGVTPGDYIISLRILRGLGFVELLPRGNAMLAGLTKLGKVVRDFLAPARDLKDVEKISTMILASLPFSTKMRVIYGLYYAHGPDYSGFYTTLRGKLLEPGGRSYNGLERIGLEVLYEIVLTRAGGSRAYVSDTQILVNLLEGYLEMFGGDKKKLNEVFRAINKHVRFPYSGTFPYDVAVWEALAPGSYLEVGEALKRYGLDYAEPLLEALRKEFSSIEYQLRGLYGLPPRY